MHFVLTVQWNIALKVAHVNPVGFNNSKGILSCIECSYYKPASSLSVYAGRFICCTQRQSASRFP